MDLETRVGKYLDSGIKGWSYEDWQDACNSKSFGLDDLLDDMLREFYSEEDQDYLLDIYNKWKDAVDELSEEDFKRLFTESLKEDVLATYWQVREYWLTMGGDMSDYKDYNFKSKERAEEFKKELEAKQAASGKKGMDAHWFEGPKEIKVDIDFNESLNENIRHATVWAEDGEFFANCGGGKDFEQNFEAAKKYAIKFAKQYHKAMKVLKGGNEKEVVWRCDADGNEINLTEEVNIEEAVEIHDQLNPKIWDDDKELRPEVRAKVLQIVDKFKAQLLVDKVDLKVEDIYILGSNANYNYTAESDLDVHIIADESFDCSAEHLPLLYNCYKALFNSKYDIRIRGINVELYVENKDALSNVSAGIYSLKDGWIRNPSEYEIPEFDQLAVDKEVQKWEDKYYELTENPTVKKIDEYIDGLYELRKDSIKNGEFAEGNLVFKEIRRRGYLDDLKELKVDLTSQELSLEGLQETWKIKLNDGSFFKSEVGLDDDLTFDSEAEADDFVNTNYNRIEFLDGYEIVNEAKTKLTYHYRGPVYHFNFCIAEDWEDYTEAVSDAQALSNLTIKAKKHFGYILQTKITLNPDYLELVTGEEDIPDENFKPTSKCEKCGHELNDAGECPVCDLGDESALNESKKLNEDLIVIEPNEGKEKLSNLKDLIERTTDAQTKDALLTLMSIYLFQTYKPSDREGSTLTDSDWEGFSQFYKDQQELKDDESFEDRNNPTWDSNLTEEQKQHLKELLETLED